MIQIPGGIVGLDSKYHGMGKQSDEVLAFINCIKPCFGKGLL